MGVGVLLSKFLLIPDIFGEILANQEEMKVSDHNNLGPSVPLERHCFD